MNFLLLGETTNHLGLRGKGLLSAALSKFTGTAGFGSDDRYFIDKLATRVFEVADQQVRIFPGNYEDYLWRKEGGAERLAQETASAKVEVQSSPTAEPAEKADARKRLNPIKLKQITERC